jgi:hypothetical protein
MNARARCEEEVMLVRSNTGWFKSVAGLPPGASMAHSRASGAGDNGRAGRAAMSRAAIRIPALRRSRDANAEAASSRVDTGRRALVGRTQSSFGWLPIRARGTLHAMGTATHGPLPAPLRAAKPRPGFRA